MYFLRLSPRQIRSSFNAFENFIAFYNEQFKLCILRGHYPLVEVSRCEAYLVVPVHGEGVEAERLEVFELL